MSPFRSGLFLTLALAVAGCATATPVAPAPIGPDDAPKLQAALMGSCNVTKRQLANGEVKEAKGIRMTFMPDGHINYLIEAIGTMDKTYLYRLEGRNIFSDGIYKSMRVDDWNGGELKLFLYEISETYVCTKI